MLGSAVLDTAIGLIFIFFVISTICSSAFSLISRWRNMRGKLLQQGLLHLLDGDMRHRLMRHPLVQEVSLKSGRFSQIFDKLMGRDKSYITPRGYNTGLIHDRAPDYIPPEIFTRALLDIFVEAARDKNMRSVIENLTKVGIDTLEREAKEAFLRELQSKLVQNKEEAVTVTQNILDKISEFDFVHVEDREVVVKAVEAAFDRQGDIFTMAQDGIQDLHLPAYTTEFLVRHIEMLTNRRGIRYLNREAQERLTEFGDTIENWFENTMDSLTGVFKLRVQVWMFFIALVVTMIFNLNALTMADTLWTNPTTREAVVTAAEARAQADIEDTRNPNEIFGEDLAVFDIPVGWTAQELDAAKLGFLKPILTQSHDSQRPVPNTSTNFFGWIMTIGAAMFGAPFWFDVLNKIVNLRTSVKPD